MISSWKHLAIASLLGGAAVLASAQQPASAPAAAPVNPAVQPAQPFSNIVSENVFNVPRRDLTKEAQDEASRRTTQPGNSAPFWREVNSGQANYASLPGLETGVLIQRTGQKWRLFRNGVITVWGGWLVVLVPLAILAFFLWRGQIRLKEPPTGRRIERFTPTERYVHWTMAISFVTLGVSGIVMLWGKHFLLPLMGHQLFGWLTYVLKNLHNLAGPLFTACIIVAFAMWVRDNLPRGGDLRWLLRLGGMFGGHSAEVPSHRFNAGEKLWFWGGLVVFGLILSASGWVLDRIVPGVDYYRSTMQLAEVVHAIAAVGMICMSLGHIYIGTIGMEGAYRAMRDGYVDEAWAKEHHALWYDDIKAGKIPAQRSKPPAPPEPREQPAEG
ncbi:formate dehydrogenase subunit gamma [Ralstonia pseudosolanacearum]|uniref:formate dehydrogenase subunit gamma n=1 Tax=Ralstonia pseudosolanacearum TaxID=1310165 RepID=UPI000B92EE01|nr:formate dehydrogenase subunit gamma [Ralstonia pseudosolanacearum]MCD9229679.1 formate dehydrogenase subunit gamma [Ralstonia pseudosolanacearum]